MAELVAIENTQKVLRSKWTNMGCVFVWQKIWYDDEMAEYTTVNGGRTDVPSFREWGHLWRKTGVVNPLLFEWGRFDYECHEHMNYLCWVISVFEEQISVYFANDHPLKELFCRFNDLLFRFLHFCLISLSGGRVGCIGF